VSLQPVILRALQTTPEESRVALYASLDSSASDNKRKTLQRTLTQECAYPIMKVGSKAARLPDAALHEPWSRNRVIAL
jgi:hypothetical protein